MQYLKHVVEGRCVVYKSNPGNSNPLHCDNLYPFFFDIVKLKSGYRNKILTVLIKLPKEIFKDLELL